MIKDCPVTVEDINIAEDIWGKDIAYLKGKSTRSRPTPVRIDTIEIPVELKMKHKEITLCIDTMYINGFGFLTAIGHPLYYRSCVPVENGTDQEYYKALDNILRVYNSEDYVIKVIECKGEYKSMIDRVCDDMNIKMNYTNVSDHVP